MAKLFRARTALSGSAVRRRRTAATKFKRRKMLISVKLLTKYVTIIYALGSVHEKFGV